MSASDEEDEIKHDARAEWWLVPKALLALGAVAVIVIVREMLLR